MDKKYIRINNEVNKLLTDGLAFAEMMELNGRKDLASWVLKTTSETAYTRIKLSGLQEKLTEFWNDKKALADNPL